MHGWAIKKPPKSRSIFYDYKGFFSVVLMALLDTDYKFISNDTWGKGHQSDGQLFGESDLGSASTESINFSNDNLLPNNDKDVPYFILGHDASPLRTYLLKPEMMVT